MTTPPTGTPQQTDPVLEAATTPRRTHPITPLVHAFRTFPLLLVLGIALLQNVSKGLSFEFALLGFVALALVLGLLTAGFQFLAWQRTTFWFDGEGDFRMDSGVITKRQRRLQLSRLQGVDVIQPLVARVVGMAEVSVEVAGAGDSRAQVRYVTLADANALRNEIIARAAGLRPDSGEAPERPLVTVPPKDLAVSLLLRGATVMLLTFTILLIVVTVFASGWTGLFWLILGGVPLLVVFTEFTRYYNFTVAHSPDGLRLRSGLFRTESQTIPPGRVQAVEFVQSWLWRPKDWVRVRLNVAGMQRRDDDQNQGSTEMVLLPVAPYDVALSVVREVLPGVDARAIPLEPAPARARWRAWIQHRALGVGADERVFVTARGKFVHRLTVVPHARTQSVRVTQGPWQRRLGLATMHVDSPPGPVKIEALYRDALDARQLADAQNERAKAAFVADGHGGRWMSQDSGGGTGGPGQA